MAQVMFHRGGEAVSSGEVCLDRVDAVDGRLVPELQGGVLGVSFLDSRDI